LCGAWFFAALRALGGRPGPDELETVARTPRETGDPEVMAMFGLGAPVTEKEAWRRFIAVVLERDDTLRFTALDLFSEMTSPGGYRRALARGRVVEDA
jgi:hypothetical protein